MDQLIRQEIASIINQIKRGDAPLCKAPDSNIRYQDVSEYRFDVVDSKNEHCFIKSDGEGTAHYINGEPDNTFDLRFLCYDDYLHVFVFDDGNGHKNKSMLKDGTKMADYIVYDKSDDKVYFIIHELSDEASSKKLRTAKKQLSDTINQLYKSKNIADFIDAFQNKICYLSAKDNRAVESSDGNADGFMKIYSILPEPAKFNFGQIGTHHFVAYETSIVQLTK